MIRQFTNSRKGSIVAALPPSSGSSRKGSFLRPSNRKGSVAVGSKAAGGKGKKAVAITGSGGDMRKNRVFQIMRQVR